MFKTFIAGLILGIAGVTGALYAIPVVDQQRENSIIEVRANGGNVERFHISIPMDRIFVTREGRAFPAEVAWPSDPAFENIGADLYKIRNERDAVIGVASRVAANSAELGPVIEWVIHLPARGSAYATMSPSVDANGVRAGRLRHGTREFSKLGGALTERFIAGNSEEGIQGRIELETALVSLGEPAE